MNARSNAWENRGVERIPVDEILAYLEATQPDLMDPGEDRWGGANLYDPRLLQDPEVAGPETLDTPT
jgi:hypothetical protein